jgi:hypothetical protein
MPRKRTESSEPVVSARKATASRPAAQRHRKSPPSAVEPEPNTEDIARLAYSLWESRGRPIGSPEEDWFLAEQQLNHK